MAAVYELYPRPDGWGCNWSGLLSRRMSLQIPPSQPCVPRETVISLCRSVSSGERDRPGGSNQCRKTFGVSVHRESCSAWVPLLAVPLMSISICYRGDALWVLLFYSFGLECGRWAFTSVVPTWWVVTRKCVADLFWCQMQILNAR